MDPFGAADAAAAESELLARFTGGDDSKAAADRVEKVAVAKKRVATEQAREARLQQKAMEKAQQKAMPPPPPRAPKAKTTTTPAKKKKADEFVSLRDNPDFRTLVAYGRSEALSPILTTNGYNLSPRALGSLKPDKLHNLLDEIEETLDGLQHSNMLNGAIKRGMRAIEDQVVQRTKHNIGGWTDSCWANDKWVILLERAKIQSGLGVNRLSPMAQFGLMTASSAMMCKMKNSAMGSSLYPPAGSADYATLEAELNQVVAGGDGKREDTGIEPPPRKKQRRRSQPPPPVEEKKGSVPDKPVGPPLPLTRQTAVTVPVVPAPAAAPAPIVIPPTKPKRTYKRKPKPKPSACPVVPK